MSFLSLCRWIAARFRVRTRYTRALEEEVARLRAENRALVNSILGVAGIPPMRRVIAARAARGEAAGHTPHVGMRNLRGDRESASRQPDIRRPAGRELQRQGESGPAGSFESQDERELQVACEIAVPLRKRSWQQIERVREIEDARAARRERETDTETFPTPRNIVPRV